jgi:hypothetical protein
MSKLCQIYDYNIYYLTILIKSLNKIMFIALVNNTEISHFLNKKNELVRNYKIIFSSIENRSITLISLMLNLSTNVLSLYSFSYHIYLITRIIFYKDCFLILSIYSKLNFTHKYYAIFYGKSLWRIYRNI